MFINGINLFAIKRITSKRPIIIIKLSTLEKKPFSLCFRIQKTYTVHLFVYCVIAVMVHILRNKMNFHHRNSLKSKTSYLLNITINPKPNTSFYAHAIFGSEHNRHIVFATETWLSIFTIDFTSVIIHA